ncbi:carboxylesterase 1E-like [Anopheles nili]|uniref:carboxylesterase 1E-like n=1 Tax=Anopheles nili TaxID=185578 RepID=UPI00237B5452|nr:carboxylesterase 1E-like [Anopheles nili]
MCIGPFIVLLVLLVVNARGDVTTEPTEVQPAPCTVQLGEQTSAEGVHNRTFNDVAYCAFLGMRYAKPPVGELRFMDPVRLDDHPKGHHTYTAYGAMCAQFDDINRQNKVKGDEDCLFLNVFTPANQTKSDGTAHKYPVLVFIHGGSFIADSGEVHGVDLLMENELIVVTLNYRLGVLGFLKYEQRNITGNYGLKDQLAALEWVRRNVHHFGGDPERVTLMGHSAGAGAVTHHLYHERARDLFKGAIVLSGSMLAPWAVLYNTRRCLDNYLRDLPASTMDEIRALDFRRFFIRDGRFRYTFAFCSMFYTCFIPTLEDRPGDGAYFSKPPYELLRERNPLQIPILMSETSTEFEFLLPHVFDFWMSDNFPNSRHPTVKRQIGSILDNVGNWAVGQGLVASKKLFYQRMANMANLHYPIRRLMSEMAQRLDPGLLYYMRFEFDGLFGEYKKKIYASDLETDAYGAIHGDELGYIFSPYNLREAIANRSAYRRELSVHIRTVELVANFVRYGNPTPKRSKLSGLVWPAYNEANNHTQYLNVDEEFTVRSVDERQNLYYLVWQVAFECLYYSRCEGVSKLEQLSQTYGAPFATRHNDYDYELFDEDTKNNVT